LQHSAESLHWWSSLLRDRGDGEKDESDSKSFHENL
jgi:hypothetical protein